MYTQEQLVAIAKRENNNKRGYLVVNPVQGKHVPVAPNHALELFVSLALEVQQNYKEEQLLLIGFAETATAIGASIAIELNSYYMQTTREALDNVDYLFFQESHSHATEQKLVKNDLDTIIPKIDRIVFIEDEVTTGNTIMNIINIMEKTYDIPLKFGVASLLNGMNQENLAVFSARGIATHYLLKTDHEPYGALVEHIKEDGIYHAKASEFVEQSMIHRATSYLDARRLTHGSDYKIACNALWIQIQHLNLMYCGRVLVLGTEEFMYPAIYIGAELQNRGVDVLCHATTRSPIAVSTDKNYPLHKRNELSSVYDPARTTYIYELEQYDAVLIITDANMQDTTGIESLLAALRQCGNQKIDIIRWC